MYLDKINVGYSSNTTTSLFREHFLLIIGIYVCLFVCLYFFSAFVVSSWCRRVLIFNILVYEFVNSSFNIFIELISCRISKFVIKKLEILEHYKKRRIVPGKKPSPGNACDNVNAPNSINSSNCISLLRASNPWLY